LNFKKKLFKLFKDCFNKNEPTVDQLYFLEDMANHLANQNDGERRVRVEAEEKARQVEERVNVERTARELAVERANVERTARELAEERVNDEGTARELAEESWLNFKVV
jgi:hypothetical protein